MVGGMAKQILWKSCRLSPRKNETTLQKPKLVERGLEYLLRPVTVSRALALR